MHNAISRDDNQIHYNVAKFSAKLHRSKVVVNIAVFTKTSW